MEKKDIVAILMRRDGISENEAWNIVEETQELTFEAFVNSKNEYAMYDEVCDILRDELGLEPDYIEVFME